MALLVAKGLLRLLRTELVAAKERQAASESRAWRLEQRSEEAAGEISLLEAQLLESQQQAKQATGMLSASERARSAAESRVAELAAESQRMEMLEGTVASLRQEVHDSQQCRHRTEEMLKRSQERADELEQQLVTERAERRELESRAMAQRPASPEWSPRQRAHTMRCSCCTESKGTAEEAELEMLRAKVAEMADENESLQLVLASRADPPILEEAACQTDADGDASQILPEVDSPSKSFSSQHLPRRSSLGRSLDKVLTSGASWSPRRGAAPSPAPSGQSPRGLSPRGLSPCGSPTERKRLYLADRRAGWVNVTAAPPAGKALVQRRMADSSSTAPNSSPRSAASQCRYCGCSEADNEEHMLLRCSLHASLRAQLARACETTVPGSWSRSDDRQRYAFLLRDARVQRPVNAFFQRCVRERDSALLSGDACVREGCRAWRSATEERWAATRGG